jgi:hypothetical protein
MNDRVGAIADLEEPTDQLVDEICQRLSSLYALVNTSIADTGPPIERIHLHAAQLVDQRRGPRSATLAGAVARTLSPLAGGQVPAGSRSTPLGELLTQAVTTPSS